MTDPTATSPAAARGRACTHWNGTRGERCGSTNNVRDYIQGPACPAHTPAALAGQPEPPEGQCAPARCYCRRCPSWLPYNPYALTADSWVTDARHIATGKKRASPTTQAAAKQTVAEQQQREQRLRKGAA